MDRDDSTMTNSQNNCNSQNGQINVDKTEITFLIDKIMSNLRNVVFQIIFLSPIVYDISGTFEIYKNDIIEIAIYSYATFGKIGTAIFHIANGNIYFSDSNIDYNRRIFHLDFNALFQLLLRNTKFKKCLFLFKDRQQIKEFPKFLNNETWKMLADVNFYGIDMPVHQLHYQSGTHNIWRKIYNKLREQIWNRKRICKQFKLAIHELNNASKLISYESNETNKKIDKIHIIHLYMKTQRSRCSIKKCLRFMFDPKFQYSDAVFIDETDLPNPSIYIRHDPQTVRHNDIFNLMQIVTYGLYEPIHKNTTLFDAFSAPSITFSMQEWPNFLTQGCYDPRLFLFIHDFCSGVNEQ